MDTNQQAIDLFEQNEYEEAVALFQRAVDESRDVQSLNNLAWIYLYEEEDNHKALELIKEVVKMNPTSYFPYNILGEIYSKQEVWKKAEGAFQKSISIQPSNEAYQNLASVYYHLGKLEPASVFYLKGAADSDLFMYSHVKCLIDLGRMTEAKSKLDGFHEKADDFIGEIEVADLYVELNCYQQAIQWFEKGYTKYWKTPNWIGRFTYALAQTGNHARIEEVIREATAEKIEEIEDVKKEEVEEHWTASEKDDLLEEYRQDYNDYQSMKGLIARGTIPPFEFEPSFTGACYLFGCKRHDHAEYER